jgi:hypothetical protein
MSLSFLFGLLAFILAVVAIARSWSPPWGLLVPVAVALLAAIHLLGGVVVR